MGTPPVVWPAGGTLGASAVLITADPYMENIMIRFTAPPDKNILCVGIDLHKCTVSLSAVDPRGQIIARIKTSTKCVEKIDAFLAGLPGPVHLAVEACPFVEWFIDRYRDRVGRIDIADATQLAALRGKRRKTDRKDADDMAILFAMTRSGSVYQVGQPTARNRKANRVRLSNQRSNPGKAA